MSKRERLEKKFREEYEKLNPAQRQAVDTIDGPVMVIAGPGTGKTQILASRIGKILLETDTLPSNILCLTYTEAGVVAMRKRLLEFIGPEAYKVNIYTFHAFCNDVIQENLSYFDKTSLDVVSELEKIDYLRQLIDAFPKNHPLKKYRGDIYSDVSNLYQLFSTMKQESWSPQFINRKIDEYIESLPTRPDYIYKKKTKDFNPGDLKINAINEEKDKMARLRAAVNEFDNFQEIMRRNKRYDFDDMILWVIKAFEENPNLLSKYQEQFLYVLVDEFQDTSGTQNRLVELLINYWEKPNVFVVGDDDQSIYRFQGANVYNMDQFRTNYVNDLATVVLTDNYRSSQPILDVSKAIIARNEERLIRKIPGLTKDLVSQHPEMKKLRNQPVIRQFNTQKLEMIHITSEIESLIADGVEPGEIAVIYKENKYGEELAKFLRHKRIPSYNRRSYNLFDLPLARKILTLLRYINAELDVPYGGEEMLFEMLHFDWFRIPPITIAKMTVEIAEKRSNQEKISLRGKIFELANAHPKDLFTPSVHPGIKRASDAIEKLIAEATNLTLQNFFESCVKRANVLGTIMQSDDKHWQLRILTGLFDFIKEETRRNPTMDLRQLIRIIDLMEKENIVLPLTQISGSENGVNLLTAHGSKGLEFDHVFLAGVNAYLWEKKKKPYSGFKMPDTVLSSIPSTAADEELRRLFYVAITRPKKHLIISYCCLNGGGREVEPSMFIEEIRDQFNINTEQPLLSEELLSDFSILQFSDEAPEIERMEEDFITQLLDRFVMNVTALNNYLKCPLEFYFNNLIRIPSPKNEAIEFGSSVHHALERLFRKMQEDPKNIFVKKEEFIADFEWYMNRHRESFTRDQFLRRMEYGKEVLSNYYDEYIDKFNKIVTIEYNIRNVVMNGVPLKGKMDKLEFDGKQVNVVDYKTGNPENSNDKLKPPNDKNPNGGNYWRQAVFYKILVDNLEGKDWKVVSTEFDFIEPDTKKKYRKPRLFINPEDIETVKQQISMVWEKIQAREFYKGCGKDDCRWCQFVKTNELAVEGLVEEES